ncbi:MAG: acyl-CoA dehydrogenase family protein [Bacillota bacterium]
MNAPKPSLEVILLALTAEFFCRTERHRALLHRAGALADRFAETAAGFDRDGAFPFPHFEALRTSGYFALTVPTAYGGEGGGVFETVLSQERLARGDGSTALAAGWHLYIIGKQAASLTWPERLRERLFREAVTDGALINAAASEPATGSPSRGGLPTTRARRMGDGRWVLTGRKNFTTLSPVLRYFLVSATIEGTEEAAWFLVERGMKGVAIEETWDSLGMRATGSHDLVLSEVELGADGYVESAAKRSGARTEGWNLHIPAVYLGIAQAARDFAIRYALERKTNTVKTAIADLDHVQRLIGEIDLALLPARTLLMTLAERWDAEPERRAELALPAGACKLFVVETALKVVDRAMRIGGGASLSRQLPLERYYRDVRAGLHNPPMEDVLLPQLARAALSIARQGTAEVPTAPGP